MYNTKIVKLMCKNASSPIIQELAKTWITVVLYKALFYFQGFVAENMQRWPSPCWKYCFFRLPANLNISKDVHHQWT